MMSVVYTPTEGDAIQNYSRLFRRPEGCYLNIHEQDQVHDNLAQWGNAEDIDYIVVTGQLPLNHKEIFTHKHHRRRGDPRHR
jgi:malic enzyme